MTARGEATGGLKAASSPLGRLSHDAAVDASVADAGVAGVGGGERRAGAGRRPAIAFPRLPAPLPRPAASLPGLLPAPQRGQAARGGGGQGPLQARAAAAALPVRLRRQEGWVNTIH